MNLKYSDRKHQTKQKEKKSRNTFNRTSVITWETMHETGNQNGGERKSISRKNS